MTFFTVAILGIIEGITEFLPISSTGHLILASHVLKIPSSSFLTSFEISIQLGAILAVVFLYWKTLTTNKDVILKIITAFIPTAIIGWFLYPVIKHYLLGSSTIVLWSLLAGGVALIIFEFSHREKESSIAKIKDLSYKKAFVIGLFQSIAIIPGVSRAAATIVGGLILNMRRRTIVEFSFLLAVPTMAAATGLDLLKSSAQISGNEFMLLAVGFFIAFAVAVASIKFLLRFIKNNTFIAFGIYRIVLAVLFLIWVI
ncbi:MAG: undecaprenyl-diphosphatase UppP [Candidatus Harrisonbacteria bacterium CG10_big_fil_rev_8_21_14_0_10_44_23]|uniref:Undecaprenyl-diphosphatase n=1 Tax=Candidatus Harrisonbacteria bacterium CG10_big_fil_rev_8_21_14_0_10_44_23 TaxID=1974585 RepID=A0A2H0UPM4_9BACT|nr:MAG: undecaprenyl-diphosphatase UppP [Candidatus Harrisonbacteria bacterium CG10_big_fil_rev_8_21_14_0_10_44_23]